MSMPPLKIIIVGAGIGGPAAAIGLARNGHEVFVYERSTSTGEIGYAFRITANSDRCLKYLGIDTEAGGAVSANTARMLDSGGHVVREFTENADAQRTKRGRSVFAYRPKLNQQLMDAAIQSGVHVKSGVKVQSVDTAKTTIKLEDGSSASADLIIASDGVHSVVRPFIVDTAKHFPRASTGHNAFRFMVSKSQVQNDSLVSSLVSDESRMFTWSGHNKRILVYPVDYDKQFNVTCTHAEELSDKETTENDSADAVAYNQKVSFKTVLDIYSDFEPRAVRLLEMAHPDGFRVWKLLDMDEIPTWSSNHTVLLGDACHPVSPFGFSGASMAIEDAATLSVLLARDLKPEQIPARLKLYEEIRKPRVGRVRQTARVMAKGGEDKEFIGEYMKFLSSHDAVEFAREELAKFSAREQERQTDTFLL